MAGPRGHLFGVWAPLDWVEPGTPLRSGCHRQYFAIFPPLFALLSVLSLCLCYPFTGCKLPLFVWILTSFHLLFGHSFRSSTGGGWNQTPANRLFSILRLWTLSSHSVLSFLPKLRSNWSSFWFCSLFITVWCSLFFFRYFSPFRGTSLLLYWLQLCLRAAAVNYKVLKNIDNNKRTVHFKILR